MKNTIFDVSLKSDTFYGILSNFSMSCVSQNGAFEAWNLLECADIIGGGCLGSWERIVQVETLILFTGFKRAIFKLWKSRIREILAKKVWFWAFNRAKRDNLIFGAFKAW